MVKWNPGHRMGVTLNKTGSILAFGHRLPQLMVFTTAVLCAGGCCTAPPDPAGRTAQQIMLANGYSLLYNLVRQQARADGIFMIKSAGEPTKTLVRQVAAVSKQAAAYIRAAADETADVALDQFNLPPMEQATRQAITSSMAGKLLLAGDDFDLQFLVAQAEGTRYGRHLATSLSKVEPDANRRQWLKQFAETYGRLHDEVIGRIGERRQVKP